MGEELGWSWEGERDEATVGAHCNYGRWLVGVGVRTCFELTGVYQRSSTKGPKLRQLGPTDEIVF